MLTWHFALFDFPQGCPYYGGVYHGKLIFPREYPLKPPSIMMLTPSGRFQTESRLCLSMSDFHPETWNPAWRIETILVGLLSFMLDPTDPLTAGGMSSSLEERRKLALESFTTNRRNRTFRSLFPELCNDSLYFEDHGFFLKTTPPQVISHPDNASKHQSVTTLIHLPYSFLALFAIIIAVLLLR